MFNDAFVLQLVLIILSALFLFVVNAFILWYLILGLLMVISALLLIDNFDIFVGFLLLIDLGVILIFLVFIFHFVNFLDNSHAFKNIKYTFVLTLFLVLFLFLIKKNYYGTNQIDSFSFLISWYDYFLFYLNSYKTDLNLLKELYFYNNSFEFILINFFILYGLMTSIVSFFILKKLYLKDFVYSLKIKNFLSANSSFFYIRNQNLINQSDEGASLKILNKKK